MSLFLKCVGAQIKIKQYKMKEIAQNFNLIVFIPDIMF